MRFLVSLACACRFACLPLTTHANATVTPQDDLPTLALTQSCAITPRTVFIYTSESRTFVVTDLGTGGFSNAPTGSTPARPTQIDQSDTAYDETLADQCGAPGGSRSTAPPEQDFVYVAASTITVSPNCQHLGATTITSFVPVK